MELQQNYPNPFNTSTKISFSVQLRGQVSLKIYDLLGREIAVLVDQWKEPGSYSVEWNAKNFSSGVYLYRLQESDIRKTKTLILLK